MKNLFTAFIALITLSSVAASASAQSCPGFEPTAASSQRLEHAEIDESSGLAASVRHNDMFWTHNDSGDDAQIFLTDKSGAHIGTLRVGDDLFYDVEDIAVAPCERGSTDSCIYVADIGDNRAKRPQVVIYKLEEPDIPDERPFSKDAGDPERIVLEYSEGPRDAETLIVDPDTLQIVIFEKTKGEKASVWSAMADTRGQPKVQAAKRIAEVSIPSPLLLGRYITAGDISPDGSRISVRTYLSVFTWCVGDEQSIADALGAEPTVNSTPGMVQSEALAYDRNGTSIWLTSERRPTPLIELRLDATEEK
ncbi:MAG: hypothetical protein ACQEVA_02815 [Myxococcota bacterium]